MKVIHLSDLHLGRSNNIKKIARIREWIINHREQHGAEVIVISGDITNDGDKRQFLKARAVIEDLREAGFRVLVVPGNHDYGPLGITESTRSAKHFRRLLAGGKEYPRLEYIEGNAFVLLNSMQGEFRSVEMIGAEGQLGRVQLEELEGILESLHDDPKVDRVVVILHHHPFDYKKFHVLRDARRFLKVLSGGDRDRSWTGVVLFGHKHIDHRFNDPGQNREAQYGLDLIYAAGSAVEQDPEGKFVIPVIDLNDLVIERFRFH